MPILIPAPTTIQAVGNKPKRIEEYGGRVNTGLVLPLPAFSPDTVHRDAGS
jgi:hypothetical protein